ncbi:hypothetical protein BGZ76_011813 [Entomortierella beljakovae]|nr:hypothetical protein BGZ76_011813 [Entomortierella beljakovae]
MQAVQEPSYPLSVRNQSNPVPRIPPRPDQAIGAYIPMNAQQPPTSVPTQYQNDILPQPTKQFSSSSNGSTKSLSSQSNTSYAPPPPSTSNLNPSMGNNTQRTSNRKMTAGSSPLTSSPLASEVLSPGLRIKPKPEMPTTLPPESVCECFICHAASPYSSQPPPVIPVNQRQELSRLAPTCPSIHLFCMASRIPMSLPLDATQKSPLTRSILDYFYSTWISDDSDIRAPRIQCLNFIPIHPITASCFDRYIEGLPWNKRICRPLWHAADIRCKLGMEGMYRNCMQDKCSSCFIFNDGFENTIAKAHDYMVASRVQTAGSNSDLSESDNKVQCMILTFAALGRAYDVPPSHEKMKRPPRGSDVVRRQVQLGSGSSDSLDSTTSEEYGVFSADALVPLVMVLYKVY